MDANWQVSRHIGEACRRAKKYICTQYSDAKLKRSDADIDVYSTGNLLQSRFYQVKKGPNIKMQPEQTKSVFLRCMFVNFSLHEPN